MRNSRPLTCRSEGGVDDWFGSDMFANGGAENTPICRAIEIDVRPKSVTRVRVSLTQSHERSNKSLSVMPPVMCPALITVKARRVVGGSHRSGPLFRTTIPLYLTDTKPALLTNGKIRHEDDSVRLHFARKLSPELACTCDMFSSSDSRIVESLGDNKTRSESMFLGESESGRWSWQALHLLLNLHPTQAEFVRNGVASFTLYLSTLGVSKSHLCASVAYTSGLSLIPSTYFSLRKVVS